MLGDASSFAIQALRFSGRITGQYSLGFDGVSGRSIRISVGLFNGLQRRQLPNEVSGGISSGCLLGPLLFFGRFFGKIECLVVRSDTSGIFHYLHL